jgi:hypothetical protein
MTVDDFDGCLDVDGCIDGMAVLMWTVAWM